MSQFEFPFWAESGPTGVAYGTPAIGRIADVADRGLFALRARLRAAAAPKPANPRAISNQVEGYVGRGLNQDRSTFSPNRHCEILNVNTCCCPLCAKRPLLALRNGPLGLR